MQTDQSSTIKNFDSLGLSSLMIEEIGLIGYKEPTAIQEKSIPHILTRKDILGQAQTGTGKTAAYLFPIIDSLLNSSQYKEKSPCVLILNPTRELVVQIYQIFKAFSTKITNSISIAPIYGGQKYYNQIKSLKQGVHIVVGTTGRILDHIKQGNLILKELDYLVLDEADEMLRMGFIEDVKTIVNSIPDSCQRLLFSATMPKDIDKIVNSYLRDPIRIQIVKKTMPSLNIRQRFLVAKNIDKVESLNRLLEIEDFDGVIVFVKTKESSLEVANNLRSYGYKVSAINGDLSQDTREKTIREIKRKKIDILVATDVLARGIDVDRISHIINYEVPQSSESYTHRIGRTGRAGRDGDAITLIYPREMRQFYVLKRHINHNIAEMSLPSIKEIIDIRISKFKEKLKKHIEEDNFQKFIPIIESFRSEYELKDTDIIASLLVMLEKHRPLFIENKPQKKIQSPSNFKSYHSSKTRIGNKNMLSYRVEVGKSDGAQTRNIVGAMINEGKINRSHIGHIKLHEDFSTIEISQSVSKFQIKNLERVWVSGKKLKIRNNLSGGDNTR